MLIKMVFGCLLAFAIGASCRFFLIPAPCPIQLQGVALVVAMTLGYVLVDAVLKR